MSYARRVGGCVVLVALGMTALASAPLGTAFTYQGRVKNGNSAVNGTADLQVSLWDDPSAGTQIGATLPLNNVAVTTGLFTVNLDFGAAAFDGNARWLQVAVRVPAGSGTFTTLTPRQPISPTPYAIQTRGLYVDANEHVGIGTTAPAYLLDVADRARVRQGPNGTAGIWFYQGAPANDQAFIGMVDDHTLGLFGSAGAGFGLQMDTFGGNIGIGAPPGFGRLIVEGSAAYNLRAVNTGNTPGSVEYAGYFESSNAGGATMGVSNLGSGFGMIINCANAPCTVISATAQATSGGATALVATTNDPTGFGVVCDGRFAASGTKSFLIDHPLDPANRLLAHYCTEGAEPLNAYSGNATLDEAGAAWVQLPEYFEAINRDFRYQLTSIGGYAPVYVAQEIQNNRFQIAGGRPGLKVSWRVEAVRNDAFVRAYGAPVELDKPAAERGHYLQPELFGQPTTMRMFSPPPPAAPQ